MKFLKKIELVAAESKYDTFVNIHGFVYSIFLMVYNFVSFYIKYFIFKYCYYIFTDKNGTFSNHI